MLAILRSRASKLGAEGFRPRLAARLRHSPLPLIGVLLTARIR